MTDISAARCQMTNVIPIRLESSKRCEDTPEDDIRVIETLKRTPTGS